MPCSSRQYSRRPRKNKLRTVTAIRGLIVPLLDAMRLGGPGCISATANINVRAIAEVARCMDNGDTAAAEALHEDVTRFRRTVEAHEFRELSY